MFHVACACFVSTCLGPLAPRGAVGARHDGLPHQLVLLLPVVRHSLSLCKGFAGPLPDEEEEERLFAKCWQSTSFSAYPFFACLRLFPEVSLWLGRPILSRAHTISVFAVLQLQGDLRTVLYACDGFPHMLVSVSTTAC